MIPIMKREGYSADYAVNVTTHASLTGALMPTSHNMIIYAFAAQAATGIIDGHSIRGVSIGDLMFAGLVPVFWIMVCMLIAAYWQAVRNGFPKRADGTSMVERFPGWQAVLRTFIAAIPGLMVIVVILACVMGGVTTATEAAAIAVAYSLLLTTVIYRTMNRAKLMKSLAKASKTTGVILLLIGVSNMLRWQMAYLEIPDAIEAALLHATQTPWLMLLVHQRHPDLPGHLPGHGGAHPDHDAAVPAAGDPDGCGAGAVRDDAVAQLRARPGAPAGGNGAVRRLRDR